MKLATGLCLYVLCICVCIFAGISIVLEKYTATRESEQAHRLTELLQSQMVRSVDEDLDRAARNAYRTAREIAEMASPVDETAAARLLGIMIESDPVIKGGCMAYLPERISGNAGEWMVYAHRTASGIESSQLGNTDYAYTSQPWFTDPIASGNPTWSKPYVDKGGGNCLMTTYSIPLKDDSGTIYAVITADVALEYLEKEIEELRPYPDSRSLLLTADGAVLEANPADTTDRMSRLIAETSHQLTTSSHADGDMDVDGCQYIACYSRISGPDIIIATVTPYKSVLSTIMQLKLPLMIIIGCGFLLLLAGIRFVIIYATRPLNSLCHAAIEIGRGDFTTPLPPAGPYADLGRLRDAMSHMTESIQHYIATIADNARSMERIESELDIARRIQQGMLPRQWQAEDEDTGIKIGALLHPAREVSGDMYDYVYADGLLYFIVADVSDKGVPASLVMASVHSLFRFMAERRLSPKEMLDGINRHLCEGNPQNMFVTIITGVIDTASCRLTIANAGHNPPLLIDSDGIRYLHLAPGLPVGVTDMVDYSQTELPFSSCDSIVLYTDGLTEAEDASGNPYGEDRLLSQLRHTHEAACCPPSELVTDIYDDVAHYTSRPLADDITIVCISNTASHISLGYDISEISRLADFVQHTADNAGWSTALTQKVNLVLEEAVSNIINYSDTPLPGSDIDVTVVCNPDSVRLHIADSGEPFDPIASASEVDTAMSAEERPVGGLGLFLIRKIADSAHYQYTDNKNNLLLYLKTRQS